MNNKTIKFAFVFMFIMLCLSLASAEYIKTFTKDTTTSNYGKIELKNSLAGVPSSTHSTYELIYNTDYCIKTCYAEGTITLYEEGKIFDSLVFKNIRTSQLINLKTSKSYTFTLENYTEEVTESKVKCNEIAELNGTKLCFSVYEKKNLTKQRKVLEEYKGKTLPAGTYNWRIEGTKNENDNIDWLMGIENLQFNEWAVWNSSKSFGLVRYWKFDEAAGTGTVAESVFGIDNGTAKNGIIQGDNGIIGKALNSTAANHYVNLTTGYQFTDSGWTVNGWMYVYSGTQGKFFMADSGCGQNYIFSITDTNRFPSVGMCSVGADTSTFAVGTGAWSMVTYVMNDSDVLFYIDGTFKDKKARDLGAVALPSRRLANNHDTNLGGGFLLDELGIWNRTLQANEVSDLWNGGAGMTYITTGAGPTITLNNPADNYLSNNPSVIFNCSALSSSSNMLNLSLIINGAYNHTIFNTTAIQNLSLQRTLNMADGYYNWTCNGTDTIGTGTATQRKITIDTIKPIINITYPENKTYSMTTNPTSIPVNFTIIDANIQACWFNNGTGNVTITCGTNTTYAASAGSNHLIFYANDSVGNNANLSEVYFTMNYIYNLLNGSASVIEGESTTFYFNVTSSSLSQVNATLNYNSLSYPMSLISSNMTGASFSRTINAPAVSADTNMTYNVSFVVNGESFTSATYKQLVKVLPSLNVTAGDCTTKVLNFTLMDEDNFTQQRGSVNYNIKFGLSNTTIKTINGTISNVTTFYICTNLTDYPTFPNISEAQFTYSVPSYTTRDYFLFNAQMNATTQNIGLYSLLSSESTPFILYVQDNSLNPVSNVYVVTDRWYPEINGYKTVQVGKTSNFGTTNGFFEVNVVDYRFRLYKDGVLVYIGNNQKVIQTSTPAQITFTLGGSIVPISNNQINGLNSSLIYSNVTKLVSYSYIDTNISFISSRLLTYYFNGTQNITICNVASNLPSNTLTCDVSAFNNTIIFANGYNTRGVNEVLDLSNSFDLGAIAMGNVFGLIGIFIGMLIILFAALAFLWDIAAGVIAIFVTMCLVQMAGLINFGFTFIMIVGVIGGVIIWITYKR